MNAHNRGVVTRIIRDIDRFAGGDIGLDEIHSSLQMALPLFERDGSKVSEAVQLAEADVEEIRFTKLLDEQRPAVVFRLDRLRETLAAGLGRM
jgi:hypothetical protein